MKRPKSDYVIQTVSNALRLLESFRDDEELGVTELAKRLDLHKNNVFRLLATLEERGYIEQCGKTDRYRLGPRCLELGRAFAKTRSLLRHARPILGSLAVEVGETAHLANLQDLEVLHLDSEAGQGLVVAGERIGMRLPAHCTALGKVLLAHGTADLRERFDRSIARAGGLPGRTPHAITDRDKFFEHLRSVANEELAVDLEECELGLSCVAVPVFDASGRCVAGLSVSGPAVRLTEAVLRGKLAASLHAAAGELSRRLGQVREDRAR
ncbi:MAG: IclR family transcriptional regulator [Myxococcales bacterium]|nr:IclR family transcriptional regulator [Myxococcales bacterium]